MTTRCPDSIVKAGHEGIWRLALEMSASVYKDLIDQGVPHRDASTVLPAILIFNLDEFVK